MLSKPEITSYKNLPDGLVLFGLADGLLLDLGGVVNEEGLKLEALGQKEVADVVAADRKVVQRHGFLALDGQLDCAEVGVHGHVDAGDGAHDNGTVLELNGDGLVVELHEEPH